MARNEATDKSYKACLVQAEAKPRRSESWQTYSTTRCCANKYQVQLCYEMHTQGTDTGNIRGMLEGMKKATGPTDSETAPQVQSW